MRGNISFRAYKSMVPPELNGPNKRLYDSRSEGASLNVPKKSGIFSCSGLLKRGVGHFEEIQFSNFFEQITFINQILSHLSDMKINHFETTDFLKMPLFFWQFFVYRRTFRPSVMCVFLGRGSASGIHFF